MSVSVISLFVLVVGTAISPPSILFSLSVLALLAFCGTADSVAVSPPVLSGTL